MKAGVVYADREVRVGEVDDPTCKADEVVIESAYAGICGTDVHIYRGEYHERVRYPAVLGHELGGTIVEVGSAVTAFRVGERVTVDPIISCHSCVACHAGRINACRCLRLLGIDLPGGMGRYLAAPVGHVHRLPDSVPLKYSPMVEMYGLGHHVLARGRVQAGETVAILGAGRLGLSVLDVLCHSASPGLTIVSDVQPVRLAAAKTLGADFAIDATREDPVQRALEITEGVGVDLVIEAVGHYHEIPGREAPLGEAVRMVRAGGRIVTAGLGEQLSPVHFKTLVLKEAEIIGTRVTLGEFPRAIRMLGKGLLHPEVLVTEERPLREIAEAFAKVDREDPQTIKLVLNVQQA